MTKIYLAGPMRGYDQFNFPAFQNAATHLRSLGYAVFSPAERDLDEGFDPTLNTLEGFDLEAALADDFRMILDADAIALLPGWAQSTGARAERFMAEVTGKDVYLYHGGVIGDPLVTAGEWDGNPSVIAPVDDLDGEVRVTNAATGGEKGSKLARFDLIPSGPLTQLAEHYGRGARKYADRNWERGYDWSLSFAALNRHLWAWWSGEDIDPETGSNHMAAVAWHAFVALEFTNTHPELDDRPKG